VQQLPNPFSHPLLCGIYDERVDNILNLNLVSSILDLPNYLHYSMVPFPFRVLKEGINQIELHMN
jgi:hypothetical protein